jgi:hypothetical protein
MGCLACDQLLAEYKRTFRAFAMAVQLSERATSRVSVVKTRCLRPNCKCASYALMAHWRQHHFRRQSLMSLPAGPHMTSCKACDELLAEYKRAFRAFSIAVQLISKRDTTRASVEEAHSLRLKCKYASNALMGHRWRHHPPPAKRALHKPA